MEWLHSISWVPVINGLAAFAALGTAIFAFLSVKELSIQRRESKQPVLALTGTTFNAESSDSENQGFPDRWKVGLTRQQEDPQDNTFLPSTDRAISGIPLELVNIGPGPAKNVTIKWELDESAWIERIKQANKKDTINIEIKWDRFVSFVGKGRNTFMVVRTGKQVAFYPYLSSHQHGADPLTVQVPPAYLAIYSCYLQSLFETGGINAIPKSETPELLMVCEYEDFSGGRYSTKFEIKTSLYSFGGAEKLDSAIRFNGKIDCVIVS